MTEPTDNELVSFATEEEFLLFCDEDDFVQIARAVLAKWGTPPAVAGEAAEHYRNAIARACEGWTMPDGLRKHLETALWSPPTQAMPPAGREPLTEEQRSDIATAAAGFNWTDDYVEAIDYVIDGVESLHGIKGGLHGAK